jgi:bacterioferritin
MKTEELIDLLKRAVADEWLAHFQYWAGAQVSVLPLDPFTAKDYMQHANMVRELVQHAQDEYDHATALGARISELKSRPPLTFREVMTNHFCGYMAPLNPSPFRILDQNIEGESCAIKFYTELSDKVKDFDPATFKVLQPILEKEKEHKADLQKVRKGVEALMPHG